MVTFTKKRLLLAMVAISMLLSTIYISRNKSDVMKALQNASIYMRSEPYGSVLMTGIITLCAVPPLLGFNVFVTMSGFIYGFPGGGTPATIGAFGGAMLSFVLLRKARFLHVSSDRQGKLQAMQSAISEGGFKMALLVRICPIPWQVSNLVLSLCGTVSWKTYVLSAFLASFKVNWEVWLGSQLANISDPDLPQETRRTAFVFMLFGLTLLCVVGIWMYRLTMQKIKENNAIIASDEERPLLCPSSE